MRSSRCLALVALVAALAGCGPAGEGGPVGQPSSPAPSSVTSPPAGNVTATDADNGHTVTLTGHATLTVRLSSTYWQFAPGTPGPALRELGQPVTVATSGCVPGEGCGTATATFQAASPGTAVIDASRSSCGEAMGCAPDRGKYSLTVIVH